MVTSVTAHYSRLRPTSAFIDRASATTRSAGCRSTDGQRPVALLAHGGSNGGWCVWVRIVPGRKTIILAATNAGSQEVCEGIDQMTDSVRATVRTILAGEPAKIVT